MDLIVIVLIIVLLIAAVGGVPGLGYPHGYGWGPSSLFGVIVVILILLLLLRHL